MDAAATTRPSFLRRHAIGLTVVLAVPATLVALLVPAVQNARRAAYRAVVT